ncbi:MAG: HAD-IIB family hydrolase [Opitutaceae bacterium]
MKALVFDLDDTLLDSRKRIGPDTLATLYAWIASDRKVILATSRPIRAVRAFIPARLLDLCEVISLNGAIHHSRGVITHRNARLGIAAEAILKLLLRSSDRVHYTIEVDGDSFATNAIYSDTDLMTVQSATRKMVVELAGLDFASVSKVSIDGLGLSIDKLIPAIEKLGGVAISSMNNTFLNVVDPSVDKSSALARIIRKHCWLRHEFAVFGDDIPDIKMMQLTDHSVAMNNAADAVKATAHFIIAHCDDDCIGKYIRLLLKNEFNRAS